MTRKLLATATRFVQDAPAEARALFAKALVAALDEVGVLPGEPFLVVHPDALDPAPAKLGPFARRSSTSRAAALENYPRAGTQRERILNEVHRCEHDRPFRGATRDELAVSLELPLATVCPRVWELIKGGWLRETDMHRETREGQAAVVLVETGKVPLALAAMRELDANSGMGQTSVRTPV